MLPPFSKFLIDFLTNYNNGLSLRTSPYLCSPIKSKSLPKTPS